MIRKMGVEDLDDIMQIEEESFRSCYRKDNYEYEILDNPCAELYVLELEGEIVGFIDYWITFDVCQLTKLAVAKAHRGNQYACDLMDFMVEDAIEKGCESILLEVRKSNVIAQSLYEKYDFLKINERKGYYSDNKEDAIVMGKVIGGLLADESDE